MKRLVYLTIPLLLLPVCAFSSIQSGDQIISANLGGAFPLSDIDLKNVGGGSAKAGAPGLAGGFQYLYHVNPSLAIGPDFNMTGTGKEQSTSFLPPTTSELSTQSAIFLAMARANIVTSGHMIPYLFGGLGFHFTRMKIDVTPPAGFIWLDTHTSEARAFVDSNGQGVAAALGCGADAYLNEQVFLGFEARFNYLGKATYDTTSFGLQTTRIQSIEGSLTHLDLLARIGYRFGSTPAAAQQASPAVAAAPAAAATGDPAIKEYVQANYRDLTRDLAAWQGPVLSELLNKLLIPEGERLDTVKKINDLSKQYPNIIDFADHVALLKR